MFTVNYSACSLCYKTIAQFHQKCLLNERLFTIQAFTITRVHCTTALCPSFFETDVTYIIVQWIEILSKVAIICYFSAAEFYPTFIYFLDHSLNVSMFA